LRSSYFLASIGVVFLLFLPNLVWLIQHHFPFLEFERNSRASGSRILRGPIPFLADQAIILGPMLAPLWIAGLAWLFMARQARRFRFAAIAASAVIVLLLILQAKNYYVAPIYPLLFAAGAVALEHATRSRTWMRPVYVVPIVISGVLLAPLVMPILPVPRFLAYHRLWRGFTPVRFENQPETPLPQYFADEFGWEEMARQTALAYNALPPVERKQTAIFANDYGQAAAIDYFGPRYSLPAAIGRNESYWLWGPRGYTGSSAIVLGSDGKGDRTHFKTVEAVGQVDNPYSRPDERFTLFLCRGLSPELHALWPRLKSW
jgi:hypothetical protein